MKPTSGPTSPAKAEPFSAQLRAKRGTLSQAQAALKLGVPKKSLQNWEQGRTVPDPLKSRLILEALA